MKVILISPPSSKPSEPPAGLAKLSGALSAFNINHEVIDASLEGMLWLVNNGTQGLGGTWSRRAWRGRVANLNALRSWDTYKNPDRYARAVRDLGRALHSTSLPSQAGLANFQHESLSPLRSRDLMMAASTPESNPFIGHFALRIERAMQDNAIVGISVNYLSQAISAFAIAGHIRAAYPSAMIVMGGGLITSWMSHVNFNAELFEGIVDEFVRGPGERRLLELAGANVGAMGHVRPDYSAFTFGDYLSPGPVLPYSGSTGCWWGKCSFCPEHAEGNAYIKTKAIDAANDIRALSERHQPALLHLLDNSISPSLLDALIESPPGVPWYGFARIDRRLGDDDYCRALKRSGCVMIKLGLESGDQGVLDALHKGISISDASAALKALGRAGIATYVYLLFGTPAETPESAVRTLEFTRSHAAEIGFLNLAVFNLPLCSPEAKGIENTFYEGDLSLYADFCHPGGWDRRSVREFLDSRFRREPLIAPIIRRTPPVFTSNHAAFFAQELLTGLRPQKQ